MILGVERKIDSLGRIVIPMEFRNFYHLNEKVVIVQTEQGLLITNPQYEMVKIGTK